MSLKDALGFYQTQRFDKAKRTCAQLIKRGNKTLAVFEIKSASELALGEFQHAIESAKLGIKKAGVSEILLLNLARSQHARGDINSALDSYKKTINVSPNKIVLWDEYSKLCLQQQQYQRLVAAPVELFKAAGNGRQILRRLAFSHQQLANYQTAITIYQLVCTTGDKQVSDLMNLGLCQRLIGQPQNALVRYKELQAMGHQSFQLWHNMGNACADLNQLDDARQYFEKAIQLNPLYLDSHANLSSLLWEMGNSENCLNSYENTLKSHSNEDNFVLAYLGALVKYRTGEELIKQFEAFKSRLTRYSQFHFLYASALAKLTRYDDAKKYLGYAREQTQFTPSYEIEYLRLLLVSGDYRDAKLLSSELLKKLPQDQSVLCYHNTATRLTELDREMSKTSETNGINETSTAQGLQLIDQQMLKISDDATEQKRFFTELSLWLQSYHKGLSSQIEQTVVKGTQTRGMLFDQQQPLLETLKTALLTRIESYVSAHRSQYQQLIGTRLGQNIAFTGSWSVVLSSGGLHTSHFHPKGVLSAVLYVDLPGFKDTADEKPGWLRFGMPNFDTQPKLSPLLDIQPEVAKLVIFPSCYWHGTLPFEGNGKRITIAFDVALN